MNQKAFAAKYNKEQISETQNNITTNQKKKTPLTNEDIFQLIQELCLFDIDYMKIFFKDNIEAVQLVLRIIMNRPDLQVLEMRNEYNMPNIKKRSLIIDIFAKDSADVYYNIEIQKDDSGASMRRARYHGSIMDTDVTPAGTDWPDIPEVYIIFITENDVRGAGLPLYHIERCIQETGEFIDDGLHIIYVNGSYTGKDDLGLLMEDFRQTDPNKMNYTALSDTAKYLKGHKKEAKDMSTAMTIIREWIMNLSEEEKQAYFDDAKKAEFEKGRKAGLADGEKIGRKAGMADGRKAANTENMHSTASRLLKLGKLTNEEIAEVSGLTIEEVDEMSRKN